MPPPDAVPEELFVEGVRLLQEGRVARVLVQLPRPLHVRDGLGPVHPGHPRHAEVVGQLVTVLPEYPPITQDGQSSLVSNIRRQIRTDHGDLGGFLKGMVSAQLNTLPLA